MSMEPTTQQETALAPRPPKAAWSPTLIVWLSIVFTFVPASIVYALNFGRLGKPEKQKRALFVAVILGTVCTYFVLKAPDSEGRTMRSWMFLASLVLSWQFYLGQQSLFVQHIKRGGKKATLGIPLAIVCVFVLFILAGGLVLALQQQDKDLKEFNRAQVLMTKGKVKEAEVIYKAFKQNNPEEPNVYWNLAVIYSQTNRNDLARQELREMLQVDPGNKRAKDFLKELEPTP